MSEKQPFEQDLAEIRNLMEKSAKFISLSGLSGILAGVYALLGAAAAWYFLDFPLGRMEYSDGYAQDLSTAANVALIALVVLAASLVTGFELSARKARKQGADIWGAPTRRLIVNLAIPLVTGGVFIGLMVLQARYALVAPVCLIFYGLALINASTNLFEEVRYLGYSEIVLGLVATALPGFGFLFWAIGFGVFHIFYGALMYRKYDR